MMKPPVPAHEAERLAALRATGILDTPPEERFDRYTRLIRRILNTPIALVSLVDRERQWFKSRMGLDAEQTRRDISFCGHAIVQGDVLVVEDARADHRFQDNPLVNGDPNVRFYAGAPLTSPDGHVLGTLCVIDHEPRAISADELESLKDIAAMVSGEMAALQLATVDPLTGLSNRRGFDMLTRQAFQSCLRQDAPATLLMFDLDEFKQINDTLGHKTGDNALIEFATLLNSTFRESDVVARLGGDEFGILLTNTRSDDAWCTVERFRSSLDARNAEPGCGYELKFSVGVTEWDSSRHGDLATLINDADMRMYKRKHGKRNSLARAAGT